jgi:Uma2 family endonuclease
MATAAQSTHFGPDSSSIIKPGRRLLTAADLAAMPKRLPSGDVSYELHHGRLVPMSPPGAQHGNFQACIANALFAQGQMKGHGKAYTEVGVVLQRKPDHIVGADAAFVTMRSLPAREAPEGYLETIPELVVEIRSKNDTTVEIEEKVADYLRAGTKLVWVVDPEPETVTEHRPKSQPKIYGKNDALTCEDIIPGFRLTLAELFQD